MVDPSSTKGLLSLGVLAAFFVTAGGNTCKVCTKMEVDSENELFNAILQQYIMSDSDCDSENATQVCPGACMVASFFAEMHMESLDQDFTFEMTSYECGGDDAPDFKTCMDASGMPEVSNLTAEMTADDEDVTLVDVSSAVCFCVTNNCNTAIDDIDPTFAWGDADEWQGVQWTGGADGTGGACFACDYFTADTSTATTVIGPLATEIQYMIDSTHTCQNPTSRHFRTCDMGEKCMYADATFTLYSDLGHPVESHWVRRECVQPKHYTENVCYTDVSKHGEIYEEMSGFFDTNDIKVSEFKATACFCEGNNYCNDGSIAELKATLGEKDDVASVRAGPWLVMSALVLVRSWVGMYY